VNASLSMSSGVHKIVVQAWDNTGGITKNTCNMTVATPAITVASPLADVSVYSPVMVTASTIDPTPVYAIQVYVDDTLKYQNSATGVNWPVDMAAGTHNLVVQAWDTGGKIFKQDMTVTVTAVPVTISQPANNAKLSSPVTVQASVPPDSNVFSMQIYVDD